jgi:maltose alpha-D-glucosyltransferase / alpha-amylase
MHPSNPEAPIDSSALWYKDALIYELHVRAFNDSNADGMGDFRGLTHRLDYLQDLGVTALWLLPFSPSPWRDDGYDIADYTDVHPSYGTLRDFHHFLREAHRRGLRVITEIVVNHTSDQHPWFQRARRAAPGSKWRDFYVWSDNPDKYKDARIIFKDFEASNWSWDSVAKAYYWHRFYSHQPDLNFDSPHVRQAVKEIADFWLGMGVDGFRLDAIPYLYEREGTNCENLAETHAYLRELRRYVDEKYPGRMLLAEANQWPEDAIAYFGAGDECNMAFHFPLMPRLFMAMRMEDRYPILDILEQTPQLPPNCQWAVFLRNHDELTLEMVTDEERDYMYRVYAHDRQMRINLGIRRRLAPLLGNDRRKIELMNALLLSLPGTPVIYYGDEIGMGDNVYLGDRNGVRTPMQWSSDRNAGFSRSNPQKLYLPVIIDPEYHYEAINVEAQQNNPHSLLWWMKRIIEQRKQSKAFGRGSIEFLSPANRRVLAFYRRYESETILVIANLSRFPQHVELDLSKYKGMTPVEVFGRANFPPIGDAYYMITIGAHGFYWFSIEQHARSHETVEAAPSTAEKPVIQVSTWDEILTGHAPAGLMKLLPGFLLTRRWFLGKSRTILDTEMLDIIPLPETTAYLGLLRVDYSEGDADIYAAPGAVANGEAAARILSERPEVVIAHLAAANGESGVLYSAVWDAKFCDALLAAIARRRKIRGSAGELVASHNREFRGVWGASHPSLDSVPVQVPQRNTTILFGDRFALKLFRRLQPGSNPETEIEGFLTDRHAANVPLLTGTIEYRPNSGEVMGLGQLTSFVPNQGDAWHYTVDALGRFFEAALARTGEDGGELQKERPFSLTSVEPSQQVQELLGEYAESARLLGRRTAELHSKLACDAATPEFAPEPFTDHYRQGLYHAMVSETARCFSLLRQSLPALSPEAQAEGRNVLNRADDIRLRFRPIRDQRIEASRIRVHGDLDLGRVLHTGKDFAFIDFEGDPSRAYGERRLKRSPLRDVASMLRSMHYAAYAVLFGRIPGVLTKPETAATLEGWASFWAIWAGALYLSAYLDAARQARLVPGTPEEFRVLLMAFVLEKALAEVRMELTTRPDWTIIPLRGITKILEY